MTVEPDDVTKALTDASADEHTEPTSVPEPGPPEIPARHLRRALHRARPPRQRRHGCGLWRLRSRARSPRRAQAPAAPRQEGLSGPLPPDPRGPSDGQAVPPQRFCPCMTWARSTIGSSSPSSSSTGRRSAPGSAPDPTTWPTCSRTSSLRAGDWPLPTPKGWSTATSSRTTSCLGAVARSRVMDFGLARPAADSHSVSVDPDEPSSRSYDEPDLTETGMVMGTPAYMAPEQHLSSSVDHRARPVQLLRRPVRGALRRAPLQRAVRQRDPRRRRERPARLAHVRQGRPQLAAQGRGPRAVAQPGRPLAGHAHPARRPRPRARSPQGPDLDRSGRRRRRGRRRCHVVRRRPAGQVRGRGSPPWTPRGTPTSRRS